MSEQFFSDTICVPPVRFGVGRPVLEAVQLGIPASIFRNLFRNVHLSFSATQLVLLSSVGWM
jgi:hypothetical protein